MYPVPTVSVLNLSVNAKVCIGVCVGVCVCVCVCVCLTSGSSKSRRCAMCSVSSAENVV